MRAECDAVDWLAAWDLPALPAGVDVPDPDGFVFGGGRDAFAVGTKGGVVHFIGVPRQRVKEFARPRVPDTSSLVLGGGDDAPSVGTVGGGVDGLGVGGPFADEAEGDGVPDANFFVRIGSDDTLPIRTKEGGVNGVAAFIFILILQAVKLRPPLGVPNAGLAIR